MGMNIVDKDISELIAYENNPRYNKEAVQYVANSIEQFGFKVPVIVDRNNVVIAGHTRIEAALKLGMKQVPTLIADDLTDQQAKAFRLADNKVAEFSSWNYWELQGELEDLPEWNMSDFGFLMSEIEENQEYKDFIEKFEPKLTTDDCYTPKEVYEAVLKWVKDEYKIKDDQEIVRPFYPGGDYKNFYYPDDCVVIDNPPFSIQAEILRYYNEKNIKYFLFGNHLTLLSGRVECCRVACGYTVEYDNGAQVNTSFYTNMEDALARTCPSLYDAIAEAQKKEESTLEKYMYPDELLTMTRLHSLSRNGVDFKVYKGDYIYDLDEMKKINKSVFGGAILMSRKETESYLRAKEQEQKNIENKTKSTEYIEMFEIKLSGRELKIVEELDN